MAILVVTSAGADVWGKKCMVDKMLNRLQLFIFSYLALISLVLLG